MIRRGAGSTGASRHTGTALLTALVMLLVLTLLATSGMNLARLEKRMAGNAQFQTVALGNAEFVLAVAEADIRSQTGNPFNPDRPGDHYYPRDMHDLDPAAPGIQQPADQAWHFSSAHVALPDIDGDGSDSDGDGIADNGNGQYVIQDAGLKFTLAGLAAPGKRPVALAGNAVQAFLVTARSRTSSGAQRTVQSVFTRGPLPGTAAAVTPVLSPGAVAAPQVAAGVAPAHGRRGWIDLRE